MDYKIDYLTSLNSQFIFMNFLPGAGNLELIELGIREIIGRLYCI
jgi:hypothetical protein